MLPHSLWGHVRQRGCVGCSGTHQPATSTLDKCTTGAPHTPARCTVQHPPNYHHHPGTRAPPQPTGKPPRLPPGAQKAGMGPGGGEAAAAMGCTAAGWPPCQLGPDQGVLRPVGPKLHMGAPGCGCLQHICMSTVALQRRSAWQSPVLVCCGIICCWGVASARAHYFRLFCIHSPQVRPLSAQGHTTLTAMPPAG